MSNIIYRGTLTRLKLAELAEMYLTSPKQEEVTEPIAVAPNPNEIKIVKQDDGNWTGWGFFQGSMKKARSWDPGVVLQMLITGQGENI